MMLLILAAGSASARAFSDRDVRNLVAPIALYPDPLLAIILPASTYVDQVIEADQRGIGSHWDVLDRQYDWNISVRALAHYPSLLHKMAKQHTKSTSKSTSKGKKDNTNTKDTGKHQGKGK